MYCIFPPNDTTPQTNTAVIPSKLETWALSLVNNGAPEVIRYTATKMAEMSEILVKNSRSNRFTGINKKSNRFAGRK